MSTNNFKYENVLIVLPEFNYDYKKPCPCCKSEDCEYAELDSDFDTMAYRELVSDIQTQLNKIGFDDYSGWQNDFNYGGKIISRWGLEDKNGFIKWLEVVIRDGYYSGINIDYSIDGDFTEESGTVKQVEALNKKFDKQVARLEKILRKNGTEYLKVAQFNNGEAVYKKK